MDTDGAQPVSSLVSSQRRRNVRRTAATGVQGKTVERNPNGGGSQDRGCHLPCRLGSAHNGALWQQVDCLAHVGQTSAHCKVRMLALCASLIPSWMYFSRHDGCAACSEISACTQWRLRWDNSSYARDGALASRGTTSAQPRDAWVNKTPCTFSQSARATVAQPLLVARCARDEHHTLQNLLPLSLPRFPTGTRRTLQRVPSKRFLGLRSTASSWAILS